MDAVEKQEHQPKSSKTMSIIYISVIFACVALLCIFIILSSLKISEYRSLKARENEIVQKYEELAKDHENFKNEDYAEAYYDNENIYIPSKDIIIEYHP